MTPANPQRFGPCAGGFTLIEVVVAVAIMAGALVAVLGLLGPTVQTVRAVHDREVAARLVDRVTTELQHHGFRNVEAATAAGPLVLYASDDGARLVLGIHADNDPTAGTPPGLPAERRYFRVAAERAAAPATAGDSGVLVVVVRVEWPFLRPGAAVPVPGSERASTAFPCVVVP